MMVVSRLLPRNSNLATHQAAQMPTTRLTGTQNAAVTRVSQIEDRVSGSASASR